MAIGERKAVKGLEYHPEKFGVDLLSKGVTE